MKSRFVTDSLAWECASAAVDAVLKVDPTQPSTVVLAAVYDALVTNDPSTEVSRTKKLKRKPR